MLSKCANPECTAPFHYLRDGKLFQIVTSAVTPHSEGPQLLDSSKPLHRVEFFWLCGPCSSTMTLAFQRGKGVITVPLRPPAAHSAAAS